MKTLDLASLGEVKILSNDEKKQINSHSEKCGYSVHYEDTNIICVDSATEAENKAGENGWWCCNCEALNGICQ